MQLTPSLCALERVAVMVVVIPLHQSAIVIRVGVGPRVQPLCALKLVL